MKNFIIMCLVALSTVLSAQTIEVSTQITTGGNYSVINEDAFTGVVTLGQVNIVNKIEEDFGIELSLAGGYSSLASTFKTTIAQVSLGFTDNKFVSGGFITQYMDKDDMLSAGIYMQLNYPLVKADDISEVDLCLRANTLVNVLEFQDLPTTVSLSVGVRYNF